MTNLLPMHYALSEAAIVAAGSYAFIKAWPVNRSFAIGLASVTLAGLIGTIRIVLGMSGSIVTLHEFLSRTGALFGLGCLVGAMLARGQTLPPLLALATASLVFFVPALTTPMFGALIITGAALAYRGTSDRRFLAAGSFAFLVCSALFSAPLRVAYPAIGWHLFHMLVALWFVLVVAFVTIPPRDLRRPVKGS
jgi:hypothetical protein